MAPCTPRGGGWGWRISNATSSHSLHHHQPKSLSPLAKVSLLTCKPALSSPVKLSRDLEHRCNKIQSRSLFLLLPHSLATQAPFHPGKYQVPHPHCCSLCQCHPGLCKTGSLSLLCWKVISSKCLSWQPRLYLPSWSLSLYLSELFPRIVTISNLTIQNISFLLSASTRTYVPWKHVWLTALCPALKHYLAHTSSTKYLNEKYT